MTYCFDGRIAAQYGVDAAIFIHNLFWWIQKNEANGRHFYDGRNWTYCSMEGFIKFFPFWTRRQIERIIRKLKDEGAIYVGNYNKSSYDRTQWYSLSELVKSIYTNGEMDLHNEGNDIYANGEMSFHQTVEPIPDSNTDSKTDSKQDICRQAVAYLNEKTGKNYKSTPSKTRTLVSARVKEGFTLEDFKRVIEVKCSEWNHEPREGEADMRKYLRPETLFGSKFEGYLNQAPPQKLQESFHPPAWVNKDNPTVEEILGVDFGDE